MPAKILWAWERPEDLRFLDPYKFGAAFLAQTLTLEKSDVKFRPRRQPLELPENIYVIAVTRVETAKNGADRPNFSAEQKEKLVALVKKTLQLPQVRAIQIDFDAAVGERGFYRDFIKNLRAELPENVPLTMTSLASWCVGDAWFNDFPVDEAVPMAFRMGADNDKIRRFLASGADWNEPLCRGSYGVSLIEPLNIVFKNNRRVYYFNERGWKESDLERLE